MTLYLVVPILFLKKVNVDVAGMLARAAKAQGVKNFVHVSALAADPDSPSRWAQTKVLRATYRYFDLVHKFMHVKAFGGLALPPLGWFLEGGCFSLVFLFVPAVPRYPSWLFMYLDTGVNIKARCSAFHFLEVFVLLCSALPTCRFVVAQLFLSFLYPAGMPWRPSCALNSPFRSLRLGVRSSAATAVHTCAPLPLFSARVVVRRGVGREGGVPGGDHRPARQAVRE